MSAIIILISQPYVERERKLYKREGDLFVDLVTHERVLEKGSRKKRDFNLIFIVA